jgi:hypothetical protein
MAGAHDVFLRSVPSDANPHDVRLYDPTAADSPPGAGLIAPLEFDDEFIVAMRKNVAGQVVAGQMNDRTTGAPLTASVSVFVTGDGGAQGAGGGTLTHEGNGHWTYAPTQAETNFNHVAFTFTHASGVHKTYNVYTYSYDPHDTAGLGLSRLDAAISSRMATFTLPTNFSAMVITAGGIVDADVETWRGTAPNVLIAGRVDANAQVVGDKTGYSLTQAFPANFASLAITAGGIVDADVETWRGVVPNVLISGRVDANAQVVGDKSGYSLTQAFPANFASLSITAAGLVDLTQGAADKVWNTAVRVLTAGTNIVLAKGVGVTGFNDILATDVWAAATRTLTAIDKTGYSLTSAERDAIAAALLDLVDAIEAGLTPRAALRLVVAALAGKISGASGTTIAIRNAVADTKDRITATVDSDGNRTAIAYDVT